MAYIKPIQINADAVTRAAIERMAQAENRGVGPMALEIIKRALEQERVARKRARGQRT